MTCGSKGEYPGRKISAQICCKDNRVKGGVRGLRGSEGPGCEIRGKQEEASDLIDADCLLFVRDTIERQFVLKWINYCRLLT